MKRLIMLAVLCAFVLGATAAQAADIKASGKVVTESIWADNWNFADGNTNVTGTSGLEIHQRGEVTFSFVANENLKGVMQLRYTGKWGVDRMAVGAGDSDAIGGTVDTTAGTTNTAVDGSRDNLNVRQVYMDFTWPDTTVNVKAGYQSVSLPNAIGGGSYILDEEIGAALVSGQITDNVSYLVGYARALSAEAAPTNQAFDIYVAALPLNFEGLSFAPFFAYAPIQGTYSTTEVVAAAPGLASLNATDVAGKDAFDAAYWLGTSFTMNMFDPFVLKGDVNYGSVTSDIAQNEKSGWLFDIALEYTGMDFMTPEVFFAYTSGEDGNGTKGNGSSERMPVIAASSWALGSFFFGGASFMGDMGSNNGRAAGLGFWALGASLKDIQSFADGLTHTAHIIYAQGTNDKAIGTANNAGGSVANVTYGRTLTEKDSLWEVDFNTAYKIYDELTLTVELGYLNLDADTAVWGNNMKGGDAYKVATGLVYKF